MGGEKKVSQPLGGEVVAPLRFGGETAARGGGASDLRAGSLDPNQSEEM